MVFKTKIRVQALAVLFDAGTEDAQGRTYSQKRTASGLGAYCFGTITRVYRTRGRNAMQKYMVKWDEGSSTAIEEQHLALVEDAPGVDVGGNADDEATGMSEFLTRDARRRNGRRG